MQLSVNLDKIFKIWDCDKVVKFKHSTDGMSPRAYGVFTKKLPFVFFLLSSVNVFKILQFWQKF